MNDSKEQVATLLHTLIFYTSQECDDIMHLIQTLPEKAFNDLLVILQKAKQNQDIYFKHLIEKDKNFLPSFKDFLKKRTKEIVQVEEQSEQDGAEDVLKDI
jgi:hypothetical protein